MPDTHKTLNSILVKPAGPDCNMGCTYCFYSKKNKLFKQDQSHRMGDKVLKRMVQQMMSAGSANLSFGWQGGEPTLMGLPFFEKALEYQMRYGRGQTVGNGLQTNGILIDRNWCRFLNKNQFLVGLSLDGPEHIHNRYRHLRGGQGSWKQVTDRAKLMLDSSVEVNALTVVNDYSVKFPQEIYNFHKSLGLEFMQFIPCVETNPDKSGEAAPFSVSGEAYGHFLIKLFDLWRGDFSEGLPTTSIRFFDSIFYNYVGLQAPDCTLKEACGIYVVVEHNGDVYACDFFVEPRWKLGNIMDQTLTELLNSKRQNQFGNQKKKRPRECEDCHWLEYCWGGCPKDRIRDPRDRGRNHFCQSQKIFFEHAHETLFEMAVKWKREQGQLQP